MSESERNIGRSKRPFSDTQEFVELVYEESYQGEIPIDKSQLDKTMPYSVIKGQYFQAHFDEYMVLRSGDKIPSTTLPVMCSIDEKPSKNIPSNKRQPNVAILYIFGDQTEEAIGKPYGVCRERIRQVVDQHLKDLYRFTTPQIQAKFDIYTLNKNKPLGLLAPVSSKRTPKTSRIVEAMRQGASTKELIATFGSGSVAHSRKTLQKRGLPFPEPIFHLRLKPIVDRVTNEEMSLEELRILIKEFNSSCALHYLFGDKPILTSLPKIKRIAFGNNCGVKTEELHNMLEKAGIPVNMVYLEVKTKTGKTGKLRYYFTFSRCEDLAVKTLKNQAAELSIEHPVVKKYGPESPSIPSTYMLYGTKNSAYQTVGRVLKDSGLPSRSKTVREKLDSSPVPIFVYKKSKVLYIRVSDIPALKQHLQS